MQPLRLGFVGWGQAAQRIHWPALGKLKDQFECVAACDSDPDARLAAATHDWAVYSDIQALLGEQRLDAVVIASPPGQHCDQTLQCLEAGCHVLCEKPIAEDTTHADRMIAAAAEAKKILLVNGQFPEMGIHRAARGAIGSGEFGALLHLSGRQLFRTTEQTEAGWRGGAAKRVCFDFGVHLIDLSRFFFGEWPERVDCHISSLGTSFGEALTMLRLDFPGGRRATFELNRVTQGPERYLDLTLFGDRARIECSVGGEASLELGLRPRPTRPFAELRFAGGGSATLLAGSRRRRLATEGRSPFADATRRCLLAFAEAIRGGPSPDRGALHHRNVLAVVLAAYDSAQQGRSLALAQYLRLDGDE